MLRALKGGRELRGATEMCHAWLPKVATNSEQGREPVCVPGGHATLTLRELLWIGAILLQFFTCVKGPRHATPTALFPDCPILCQSQNVFRESRHAIPILRIRKFSHATPFQFQRGMELQSNSNSSPPDPSNAIPRHAGKLQFSQFLWNGVGMALDYNPAGVGCDIPG